LLDLSFNQLTGAIPDFSALTQLESLSLFSNQLTGTIPDFSALPKLERLWLDDNPLCKDTPAAIILHGKNQSHFQIALITNSPQLPLFLFTLQMARFHLPSH